MTNEQDPIYFKRESHAYGIQCTEEYWIGQKDWVTGDLVSRVRTFLFVHRNPKQEVTYTFGRPSFLDWVFRKKKTVTIEVQCLDILKNPPMPETQHTVTLYSCNVKGDKDGEIL